MIKLDVYDFDGTLYNGDSTLNFYIYCLLHKIALIRYLPIQLLYLIRYKLKLVKKEKFKEKFFLFLKGIKNVDKLVQNFWKKNEMKINLNLINNGFKNKKVVISASPEFLLKDICKSIGIEHLIASKVDKNTGKFLSNNCYGEEKVVRLNDAIKEDYEIENFYTDSISDKYLAMKSYNSFIIKNGKKQIEKQNNNSNNLKLILKLIKKIKK